MQLAQVISQTLIGYLLAEVCHYIIYIAIYDIYQVFTTCNFKMLTFLF